MKIPPYCNVLLAHLKAVKILKTQIMIYCGSLSFPYAKELISHGGIGIAFTKEMNPSDYFWPVENNNVILDDTGDFPQEKLIELGCHLINYNPCLIVIRSESKNIMEIIDPSLLKGINNE